MLSGVEVVVHWVLAVGLQGLGFYKGLRACKHNAEQLGLGTVLGKP